MFDFKFTHLEYKEKSLRNYDLYVGNCLLQNMYGLYIACISLHFYSLMHVYCLP